MKKSEYYKKFIDSDNDGLSDFEEENVYFTDPFNSDTDADGVNDGDEVALGRNPNGIDAVRDFFIPHEGNGYLPNVLHPKRLIFHAGFALLIKIIVFFFAASFPIEAWMTPDLLSEQGRKIIALTNEIRESLNLSALSENSQLDHAAFSKSQDMLLNQYFDHVSPSKIGLADWLARVKYNYSTAGENLAMGFADSAEVVNAWTRSRTHYNNIIDPSFKEIGVGAVNGSYAGEETTLVAQFFGSPGASVGQTGENKKSDGTLASVKNKMADVLTAKSASAESPAVSKEIPGETEKNEAGENPVFAGEENNLKALPEPMMIAPDDNILIKDPAINFKIFAPLADKVYVYLDKKEIMLANAGISSSSEKSYYELSEKMDNGAHAVMLKSVRGNEEKYSKNYNITIDVAPPEVDKEKTKIFETDQGGDSQAVSAVAYLSADTKKASINFGSNYLELEKDGAEPNKWTGRQIVFKENKKTESPITLPVLSAEDFAGNSSKTDIRWENIVPVKVSLLDQYMFFKGHQSPAMKKIFDISSSYYRILLLVLTTSLLLNIFIEIRKQHPHVIFSTVGLIGLLVVLIIL